MYFQLSVQRYVPWRYHLLCVEITEQIWHNRTKIQTGRSFGQFLVTRDQGKFGCLAADFLTLPISPCLPSSSSLFPPSSFSQPLPFLWIIRLNHLASSSSLNFFTLFSSRSVELVEGEREGGEVGKVVRSQSIRQPGMGKHK